MADYFRGLPRINH